MRWLKVVGLISLLAVVGVLGTIEWRNRGFADVFGHWSAMTTETSL